MDAIRTAVTDVGTYNIPNTVMDFVTQMLGLTPVLEEAQHANDEVGTLHCLYRYQAFQVFWEKTCNDYYWVKVCKVDQSGVVYYMSNLSQYVNDSIVKML